MPILDVEQRSKEWLKLRRSHIGGSDAGTIMGCNPYRNLMDLYEDKVLGKETPINLHMQRGIDLESHAIDYFSEIVKTQFAPAVIKHSWHEFMLGSFDGYNAYENCGFEIKCPRKASEGRKIPEHYWWQCQHLMEVGNLDYMYYGEYIADGDSWFTIVQRDYVQSAILVSKEKEFFENHMLKKIPPGTPKNEDEEMLRDKITRLKNLREIIGELTDDADKIKCEVDAAIKDLYGDQKEILLGTHRIARVETKGQVDYGRIPELENVDLSPYRKETRISWRIN